MKYVVSLVSFFERYFIAHILIHRPFLKGVLKHSDHASVRVKKKKQPILTNPSPSPQILIYQSPRDGISG